MNEQWDELFKLKIQTNLKESFSILMHCECNLEQEKLLRNLLFEDHKSLKYWIEYIDYCCKQYLDRKDELHKLVEKAIEIINGTNGTEIIKLSTNQKYVALHLKLVKLKK
jgi:hypothetical protein